MLPNQRFAVEKERYPMQKTNNGDGPFGAPRNFPLAIAEIPQERRIALGFITLLFIAVAIMGPLAMGRYFYTGSSNRDVRGRPDYPRRI
jgi:hypothetical protein